MEPPGASYSSVHMRERDKILEEKHKKEFAIIERKLEKLKWSNKDILKQLFEMQARANHVAQNLGFHDIYEAQVYVDNADCELPYKECFESLNGLKEELSREKTENERLQERLKLAEQERDQYKSAASADHTHSAALAKYKNLSEALSGQVDQLQSRYDELVEVKERAAARYKLDYSKWKKIRDWLFNDKTEDDEKVLSEGEKKKRELARIKRKKELLKELGFESILSEAVGDEPSNTPSIQATNCESNKENQTTLAAPGKKSRLIEPPTPVSQLPLSPTLVEPVKNNPPSTSTTLQDLQLNRRHSTAPSSSPSIFLDAPLTGKRTPLMFRPVLHVGPPISQEVGSSPLLQNDRPLKRRHFDNMHAASSDTEDDSQAIGILPAPITGYKAPEPPSTIRRKLPLPPGSSDTEPESQSQAFPISTPRGFTIPPKKPFTEPIPSKGGSSKTTSQRRSDVGVVSRDATTLQPLKMMRLHDDKFEDEDTTISTPQARNTVSVTSKSAGKQKEIDLSASTPRAPTTAQKRIDDYSAFKGRGRYGKKIESENKPLNATYVIDPTRNGGLDFQYEEVVRKKSDRKKMDAADCECCRDYYEAVGPLPNRLQAPLWRSPVNSPSKPCSRHQQDRSSGSEYVVPAKQQSEINAHKQAISRHRNQWARAKTPPGYWNIGFPDTQEVENINEQAREMHMRKRAEVEDSVKRGDSRYKKR